MNSKELVLRTLNFDNPDRVPRQLWLLPWAVNNYSKEVKKIQEDFPDDITGVPGFHKTPVKTYGDPYEIGEYIDEWGCRFTNYQKGVIGEIKEPLIGGEEWEDKDSLKLPESRLDIDIDKINDFCRQNKDKFLMAGACPRPFERMQFIRGTEQFYMDLMLRHTAMFDILEKIHGFYCKELELWAKTDVDALMFMDDWGSQNTLLINPDIWVKIFKPMYKDFIDIAHSYNKKIFMHSDGYILPIIPHLIELGLDAVNSQIFCMDFKDLSRFKGKITFWGEIDRQHLLPDGTTDDIEEAVKLVKNTLWENGGCIAQCEFGAGANPNNVYKVFETWNNLCFNLIG
jgi:uroporphyrinogen decarboxylase